MMWDHEKHLSPGLMSGISAICMGLGAALSLWVAIGWKTAADGSLGQFGFLWSPALMLIIGGIIAKRIANAAVKKERQAQERRRKMTRSQESSRRR